MRRAPALAAVLLVSGCSGGDESATETITRTETVTVTETATDASTTAPNVPPRLPSPLPADGTLPVEAFNAYTESIDEPWERDLEEVTDAFVEAGASDATARSFQATSSGEGGSASASLVLGGLLADSVRAQRYELKLIRRHDGSWKIASASWAQRCQEGRGHQAFTAAPCI
jgi:hypothetical protein